MIIDVYANTIMEAYSYNGGAIHYEIVMVNPSDPMGTIYLWRESVLGDRFEPEMDEPF